MNNNCSISRNSFCPVENGGLWMTAEYCLCGGREKESYQIILAVIGDTDHGRAAKGSGLGIQGGGT